MTLPATAPRRLPCSRVHLSRSAKLVSVGMNPMEPEARYRPWRCRASRRSRYAPRSHLVERDRAGGTIAANGDAGVGEMIARAMEKVGNEGVITVEEARTADTELDVVEGHGSSTAVISLRIRDQCREDARGTGGSLYPHPREEARQPAGYACLSWRAAGAERETVADHLRRREGEVLATLVVNRLRGA